MYRRQALENAVAFRPRDESHQRAHSIGQDLRKCAPRSIGRKRVRGKQTGADQVTAPAIPPRCPAGDSGTQDGMAGRESPREPASRSLKPHLIALAAESHEDLVEPVGGGRLHHGKHGGVHAPGDSSPRLLRRPTQLGDDLDERSVPKGRDHPGRIATRKARRAAPFVLIRPRIPAQRHHHRPPENPQIQRQRPVAQVLEVVLDAPGIMLDRFGLAAARRSHARPVMPGFTLCRTM